MEEGLKRKPSIDRKPSSADDDEHLTDRLVLDGTSRQSVQTNPSTSLHQPIPNVTYPMSIGQEFQTSLRLMMDAKLNILLICGPLAFIGSFFGIFGEALCFCLAGLALIPMAERLSFVTEQVAEHTNETIGALLNATFGNAPEFLISSAALRSGFYRVVQLTLLGSMLTNLLFVFGLSCLIGGLQWQVQELRITSGNVSIAMLLIATMGLVLPATLKLANQSISSVQGTDTKSEGELTVSDIYFSRVNALVMVIGYCCYLLFQLGSHKEEFDYDGDEYGIFGGGHNIVRTSHYNSRSSMKPVTKRNLFCRRHCFLMKYCPVVENEEKNVNHVNNEMFEDNDIEMTIPSQCDTKKQKLKRKTNRNYVEIEKEETPPQSKDSEDNLRIQRMASLSKSHASDIEDDEDSMNGEKAGVMSMRLGLLWLGIVTTFISIVSDILVETIDGFAARSPMSEVFVSVIIIPFFSNIAEQVSAVIFAYKNKMDLCVGVTVGSAIQIGQFVMPGCVLVGWVMDKEMTLYFRGYETICLLLGVLCIAAVLQGGTTNWLVGVYLVSVYTMISAGFAFHERENLAD